MGIGYWLINHTKRERIIYSHIGASSPRELAGNPVSAAITTWYLLQNPGDKISFVSDSYDDWPFPAGSKDALPEYREVTDEVANALIDAEILCDEGREQFWEDEPDVYLRKLRHVWLK